MDILVRGLPPKVLREIEEQAKEERVSVSDLMLKLIQEQLGRYEEERKKEAERIEMLRRLEKIRRRLRRSRGSSSEANE